MTESNSRSSEHRVEGLRREGAQRTYLVTLLTSTVASFYLATAFPWFFGGLLPLGTPIDHVIVAAVVFAGGTFLLWVLLALGFRCRLVRANLAPIRIPSIRRRVSQLGRSLGLRPITMASGGWRDTKYSALVLGKHSVVRIGRGALPIARLDPGVFDFRVAHELAHLASRDPQREDVVRAVYLSALVVAALVVAMTYSFIIASSLSPPAGTNRLGFWISALRAAGFATAANGAAIAMMILVFVFEARSAQRMQEFHADALARTLAGPASKLQRGELATCIGGQPRLWRRLLGRHPALDHRVHSVSDVSAVFRYDRVLFFVQGYFSTLVLELLLQALYSGADPWLATVKDRGVSIGGFLARSPAATGATIALFAILLATAHMLAISRLAITITSLGHVERRDRRRLASSALTLTALGAVLCLGTSVGVLWGLKLVEWDFLSYAKGAVDRHLIHAANLLALFAMYALVIARSGQTLGAWFSPWIQGCVPVVCTLAVGATLYVR